MVSQDELADAAGRVADRLDGAAYVLPALELRRELSVELGHPVDLVLTADVEPDTADRQQTAYDVTLRATDSGPAMCFTVTVTRGGNGQTMNVSSADGLCGTTS